MTITIEIQAKTNQHLLELASDRPDVLRPRSFRAVPFVVGHSLSFLEFFVAHAFEVRHVEEHVCASASVDETKTLVRQFLDCAFCHLQSDSQKKVSPLRCPTRLVQALQTQKAILPGGAEKTSCLFTRTNFVYSNGSCWAAEGGFLKGVRSRPEDEFDGAEHWRPVAAEDRIPTRCGIQLVVGASGQMTHIPAKVALELESRSYGNV